MYVCGCEKYLASLKIIFLERARNHLELSGDKLLLDLRWGGGQEGDCVSQVPTKSWALVCIDSTWGVDKAQPLGPDRLDLGKSLYCSL